MRHPQGLGGRTPDLRSPAVTAMDPALRAAAEAARGFMPPDEGLALHDAALAVEVDGPFLEVGSYCGKSGVYLGAAAKGCRRSQRRRWRGSACDADRVVVPLPDFSIL